MSIFLQEELKLQSLCNEGWFGHQIEKEVQQCKSDIINYFDTAGFKIVNENLNSVELANTQSKSLHIYLKCENFDNYTPYNLMKITIRTEGLKSEEDLKLDVKLALSGWNDNQKTNKTFPKLAFFVENNAYKDLSSVLKEYFK